MFVCHFLRPSGSHHDDPQIPLSRSGHNCVVDACEYHRYFTAGTPGSLSAVSTRATKSHAFDRPVPLLFATAIVPRIVTFASSLYSTLAALGLYYESAVWMIAS
jgi:hypothetical protein